MTRSRLPLVVNDFGRGLTTNDDVMTWIKICGITNLEDALVAAEAGADALGFVFYEKSPRNIDPQRAKEITSELPTDTEKVGIFAGMPLEHILDVVERAGLTAAQVYGNESEISEQFRALSTSTPPPKLIFAFDGNGFSDARGSGWLISRPFAEQLFALLVDCKSGSQPGGTGNKFDWSRARGAIQVLNTIRPTVVAGGLEASNVQTAMTLLHPWGVDVSSGVEARAGKKDPDKVRAFIKAVREADKANSRN
jgi:phosphoribosylanthranilate isomerase